MQQSDAQHLFRQLIQLEGEINAELQRLRAKTGEVATALRPADSIPCMGGPYEPSEEETVLAAAFRDRALRLIPHGDMTEVDKTANHIDKLEYLLQLVSNERDRVSKDAN